AVGLDRSNLFARNRAETGEVAAGISRRIYAQFGKQIGGFLLDVDFSNSGIHGFPLCMSLFTHNPVREPLAFRFMRYSAASSPFRPAFTASMDSRSMRA